MAQKLLSLMKSDGIEASNPSNLPGTNAYSNVTGPPRYKKMPPSQQSNLIDVQQLIENYAWEHFLDIQQVSGKGKNEFKGIDRDEVAFEVNMKNLIIEHSEPDYQNFHPTSAKPWTLFKTVFSNNTDRPQEYSFKTERSTESICSIYKEQGYTFGVEAQLSLKTPCEILEANAGFKHEIEFRNANENTVAEVLTWGVDSNIVVPAHYQTTAELVVEEMHYTGRFNVTTTISGRCTVSLIRRRDGQLIMPLTLNILEVFRDALQQKSNAFKSMCTIDGNGKTVTLHTLGHCQFQFAMKQHVRLDEEPIGALPSVTRSK